MPLIPPKHFTPGTSVGDVLSWDGSAWVSAPAPSGFTPGGDLGGDATSQIVQGIQGSPFTSEVYETGLMVESVVEPTISFTNPTGCVSDESHLWVCDRTQPYVYKANPDNWYAPLLRISLRLPSMGFNPTPAYLFFSEGYIICTASRDILIIDPTSGTLVGYVYLTTESMCACIDSNRNLWVSSPTGVQYISLDSILAAFPNSAPPGTTITLGAPAKSIILDFEGMIWTGFGTHIHRIDPNSDTVETRITAGFNHEYILSAADYIWVSQFGEGTNTVLRYDPETFPSAPTQIALDPTAEYPGWMAEFNGILYVTDNDIARIYTINTSTSTYTGYVTNGTEAWLNQITYYPGEFDTLWVGVSQGVNGYASYIIGDPSLGTSKTSFFGGSRIRWGRPQVSPLSNVFYVDGGTQTEPDNQTGSIAQPFSFLSKAVGVAGSTPYPGPTLLIAPGNHSFEVPLYWASPGNPPAAITFRGLGNNGQITTIPSVTVLSGNLALENVRVQGFVQGSSYVRLNKASVTNSLKAGFLIAENSSLEITTYIHGGTFSNCTFEGSSIFALDIKSNDAPVVNTTVNNTLRVRSYPSDPYTEVLVPSGPTTSKYLIAEELTYTLLEIGIHVELDSSNQIILKSNTGMIEFDSTGSTLNDALGIPIGMHGPASIDMDSVSYGSFHTSQGTYRGQITLDAGKSYAAFKNLHTLQIGTDWETLVVMSVPIFSTDMYAIDWTISGKRPWDNDAFFTKNHSVARRLGATTTIANTTTELSTSNATGRVRIIILGDFIHIQVAQDDLFDWNVQAEVLWTKV